MLFFLAWTVIKSCISTRMKYIIMVELETSIKQEVTTGASISKGDDQDAKKSKVSVFKESIAEEW